MGTRTICYYIFLLKLVMEYCIGSVADVLEGKLYDLKSKIADSTQKTTS